MSVWETEAVYHSTYSDNKVLVGLDKSKLILAIALVLIVTIVCLTILFK